MFQAELSLKKAKFKNISIVYWRYHLLSSKKFINSMNVTEVNAPKKILKIKWHFEFIGGPPLVWSPLVRFQLVRILLP